MYCFLSAPINITKDGTTTKAGLEHTLTLTLIHRTSSRSTIPFAPRFRIPTRLFPATDSKAQHITDDFCNDCQARCLRPATGSSRYRCVRRTTCAARRCFCPICIPIGLVAGCLAPERWEQNKQYYWFIESTVWTQPNRCHCNFHCRCCHLSYVPTLLSLLLLWLLLLLGATLRIMVPHKRTSSLFVINYSNMTFLYTTSFLHVKSSLAHWDAIGR